VLDVSRHPRRYPQADGAVTADQPTATDMDAWRAYLDTGSVREAARRLGVHEQTVKRHLSAIRSRLGVKTNAQAAAKLAHQLPT